MNFRKPLIRKPFGKTLSMTHNSSIKIRFLDNLHIMIPSILSTCQNINVDIIVVTRMVLVG